MNIQEVEVGKKEDINLRKEIISIKKIEKNRRSKNRKNQKDTDLAVILTKKERKSVLDLDK